MTTPRVTVPVEDLIAELRDYLIADRPRRLRNHWRYCVVSD